MDFDVPVDFIDNAEFRAAESDSSEFLLAERSIYADAGAPADTHVTAVGDFELLQNLPLLSPAGERFLFRKMNFLKHCAERLRLSSASERTAVQENEILALLQDADAIRNHIAECNLRLVISVARKFATANVEFDELMSEGNEILLKAIQKFDYSLGYRFSTYAVNSIQRHYFRYLQRRHRRTEKERASPDELVGNIPQSDADELITEWIKEEERVAELIQRFAEALDEREERVIRERFGLGGSEPKTLRQLAEELSLSKERVRQLQLSALKKLRELHQQIGGEEE